jgi:hypothetical protein
LRSSWYAQTDPSPDKHGSDVHSWRILLLEVVAKTRHTGISVPREGEADFPRWALVQIAKSKNATLQSTATIKDDLQENALSTRTKTVTI